MIDDRLNPKPDLRLLGLLRCSYIFLPSVMFISHALWLFLSGQEEEKAEAQHDKLSMNEQQQD